MKVRGRSLFVLAVLAAACSNSATTPTSAPPVTAAPVTTTTTPPATTTTTTTIAATTIPATTTTLSGDTVGNPAALEALIDRVVAEVGAVNLGGRENVPVFSANDPDPSVALKSNLDLEDWVFKTFPDPAWAEVLTYPNSPA
ncbi:MAG: hypothetical protein OEO77_01705, partial [Acidimicrobiia bacterium]|nr:hypothetical protein [Acidimicrobiia bacterium]